MGDRSYMQITVYDCPDQRPEVAELLGEYVGLEFTDTVYDPPLAVGQQYTAEEMYLGSMRELAGKLIALAPRCSFTGWQDPFEQYLGELAAYCPEWGRFDADCTGEGRVVLSHQEITAVTEDANRGYLARDTMLGLHCADMIPAQVTAWQSRPGLTEAIEVAYGVPWQQHATGANPPQAKKLAWAAVIDRQHQEAAEARRARLLGFAGLTEQLGLHDAAHALRDATDPGRVPGAARAAADACAAAVEPLTAVAKVLTSLLD